MMLLFNQKITSMHALVGCGNNFIFTDARIDINLKRPSMALDISEGGHPVQHKRFFYVSLL